MFCLVNCFMSPPSFYHLILKLHILWKREGAFLHFKAGIHANEWHSFCLTRRKQIGL